MAGRSAGTTIPGTTAVSNFPRRYRTSRTARASAAHSKRNVYSAVAPDASVRFETGRRHVPPAARATATAAAAWTYGVNAPALLSKYSSFVFSPVVITRYGPTALLRCQ